jgi:hypothetical protein
MTGLAGLRGKYRTTPIRLLSAETTEVDRTTKLKLVRAS